MKLEFTVLIAGILISIVVVEFVRRRRLRENFVLLWSMVGLGAIVLAIARPLVDRSVSYLGIESGTSVVFSAAIIFLLFVCVHLSIHVTRAETRCDALAEELAFLRGALPPQDDGEVPAASAPEPAAPDATT